MPLTDTQRAAIVAEAKTWNGTPYRGWSCKRGPNGGTDCGQLLYGVFHSTGHVPVLELPKDYSLQVAQHQASTEYVDLVSVYFREITQAEVKPGDLAVYKLGHAYAHAGIVIEWPEYVLQASARHGVAGAHGTKTPWLRNKRSGRVDLRFFTLKNEYCEGK